MPACLDHAVKNLPIMDQKVAIILDISSSMASSGERSQHPAGLGLALTRILQKQFPVTSLYQVGGTNNLVESAFAFPQGQTDLASSLLEAVSRKPDSVMFITDGYENTRQGDVADVVTGMRQIAINTPIYQIVPLFTHTEDLTQRTLSADIEVITIAHETEISDLFAHVLLEQTQDVSPNKLQLCKQLLTRS
ncbi:hypothetical protein TI05_04005 [Achromatium sp. WMS3]|nr:hypothetical protein TI05_04005 [Achromatium sp. WMS3]